MQFSKQVCEIEVIRCFQDLNQNCTYRDVLASYCLHGMMDLYGEKRLVILVPNICHLVFTVGFFSCHLVFTVGSLLISSPRRDNILSQSENSAIECGASVFQLNVGISNDGTRSGHSSAIFLRVSIASTPVPKVSTKFRTD